MGDGLVTGCAGQGGLQGPRGRMGSREHLGGWGWPPQPEGRARREAL